MYAAALICMARPMLQHWQTVTLIRYISNFRRKITFSLQPALYGEYYLTQKGTKLYNGLIPSLAIVTSCRDISQTSMQIPIILNCHYETSNEILTANK